MKKLILTCLSAALIAGTASAQITVGPEAGLNISNYSLKGDAIELNTTSRVGGRFGAVVDIPLSDHLSLQPAALYVMNGFKISLFGLSAKAKVSTIEVPVNVMYKFNLASGDKVFAGVGPYFAYNVAAASVSSAGYTFTGSSSPISASNDLKIGSDADAFMKAFDFGFGLNAGYQLSMGLFVNLHYQFGITNLIPVDADGYSIRNHNYGLTVGYLFGGNKTTKKTKTKTTRTTSKN